MRSMAFEFSLWSDLAWLILSQLLQQWNKGFRFKCLSSFTTVLQLNVKKTRIMASGLITTRQIEGGKAEVVTDSLFLGSKITLDGDWSRGIRGQLLLGRKAIANLGSVLKSRDIFLLTKVHMVKAMVFPALVYSCESWTVKKNWCQRIDAFEPWC